LGSGSGEAAKKSSRLARKFETGGLRRIEFCQKHRLALGALQRGLKRRLMEVEG